MSNNTTCLTCQHWLLRESGDLAKHRFAKCAHGPIWRFLAPSAACSKHKPVAADKAAARVAWMKKG